MDHRSKWKLKPQNLEHRCLLDPGLGNDLETPKAQATEKNKLGYIKNEKNLCY